MKIIFFLLLSFILTRTSNSQNYFTSKMAMGVHFNAKTDADKKFKTGFYFSGYTEPKISNSGNLVFNIDFGLFNPEFQSSNKDNGVYGLLAGYKQKFFAGESNYYITGLVGLVFKGFGFKAAIGNEYRILKKSFLSLDFFYVRTVINSGSGDGTSDKVASVFGITLGAGIIHK